MIGGFHPCSFIDFPGHLASVVFTQGCNLRCRYCHNPDLCGFSHANSESLEHLLEFWNRYKNRLTGVVITGGEPTLHAELPELLRVIRSLPLAVKLDTNGTHPEVVRTLLADQLIQYLAVDVKVPPGTSSRWLCGEDCQPELALETLGLAIERGIPCEARTTVVQGLHEEEGLMAMAKALWEKQITSWYLQTVRNTRVLDDSVTWKPPTSHQLLPVQQYAEALGLHVFLRSGS